MSNWEFHFAKKTFLKALSFQGGRSSVEKALGRQIYRHFWPIFFQKNCPFWYSFSLPISRFLPHHVPFFGEWDEKKSDLWWSHLIGKGKNSKKCKNVARNSCQCNCSSIQIYSLHCSYLSRREKRKSRFLLLSPKNGSPKRATRKPRVKQSRAIQDFGHVRKFKCIAAFWDPLGPSMVSHGLILLYKTEIQHETIVTKKSFETIDGPPIFMMHCVLSFYTHEDLNKRRCIGIFKCGQNDESP